MRNELRLTKKVTLKKKPLLLFSARIPLYLPHQKKRSWIMYQIRELENCFWYGSQYLNLPRSVL